MRPAKIASLFLLACSIPAVAEWSIVEGTPANAYSMDGALVTGRLERDQHVQVLEEGEFSDGLVEATFDVKPGLQNYGIVGRADGAGTFYIARVFANGGRLLIARNEGGAETVLGSMELPVPVSSGIAHIRFEMKGRDLAASVQANEGENQGSFLEVTDDRISSGRFGIRVRSHFAEASATCRSFRVDGKPVPLQFAGEEPPESLSSDELFRKELKLGDAAIDLTKENWKLLDKNGNTAPVEVGQSLIAQGHPAGEYRYTVDFSAAKLSSAEELFLLELGPVYQSDVTRINGHLVGGYGENPPPFAKAHIAQEITRRYVIPASWLHRDKPNHLEVEVATGTIGGTLWYAGGGIFQGPVRLSPLRQQVLVDFALRDPNLSSVTPLLSDAVHLNRFLPRSELPLRLRLAPLNPEHSASEVRIIVRLENRDGSPAIVEQRLSMESGHWSEWVPLKLPMPGPGNHLCSVEVRSGAKVLYEKKIPFVVEAAFPSQSLATTWDAAQLSAELVWQKISSRTVGSFGARSANAQKVLEPGEWDQDVRGTLATVIHANKDSPRPMLLFPGTQQPPQAPYAAAEYQEFPLGRNYDGFDDTWPLGFIRLGASKDGESVFRSGNWVSRSYLLRGKNRSELGELMISKLSPAIRLTAKTSSAVFFEDLPKWGIEGPSRMAYAGDAGIQVCPRGAVLDGKQMKENWILVWFHGSKGWGDFDIPWLFVLERRPEQVVVSADGFALNRKDNRPLGKIYAMPFTGVRLLEPATTEAWQQGIDESTLTNIRRWAGTLPAYPVDLDRSVAVDWTAGDVFLRERIRFEKSLDDWSTTVVPVVPTPPVLALGMHSENLTITASARLDDFHLVTAFGPFVGAIGTNEVTYRISGLLKYVNEAPVHSDDAGKSEEMDEARRKLQETAKKLVAENRLQEHPWAWSIWRGKFTPGNVQFEYSSILGSLPYLDEAFRGDLRAVLRDEVNKVFLPRTLERDAVSVGGWKPLFGQDLYQDIREPLTGQKLVVLRDHLDRRAIDTPFWQSFQIYTIWQAAHHLGNWTETTNAWGHISGIAELPLHSHDWAALQSWDFFSGYRVGNGIQESGGMYAGYAAMARMAHHLGHFSERDLRAGLAVLQLVGMNVANTGIEYMRFHRPWSGRNTTAKAIGRAEKMFPSRYIEYNEFTGSPVQAILLPWQPLFNNSYIHDLLPDVMRVYPALWPKENAAFFRGAAYDPPLDMVVRMEQAGKQRVEAVYRNQIKSPKDLERLMAARAFLESAGAMRWEAVIPGRLEKSANTGYEQGE